jgi:hypothetical protein
VRLDDYHQAQAVGVMNYWVYFNSRQQGDLRWVWPRVRDHLTRCGVLIGSTGIKIRPYRPPTALCPGYIQARSRKIEVDCRQSSGSCTIDGREEKQAPVRADNPRPLLPHRCLENGALFFCLAAERIHRGPSSSKPQPFCVRLDLSAC